MTTPRKTLSGHYKPALVTTLLTAVILALVLLARGFGVFVPLELLAHDFAVQRQAGGRIDPRIVLVMRTEGDLHRLGYPTSDQTLAQLLEKLLSAGAAVIGVDVYRDVPVPPGEAQLATQLEAHRNIVWVMKFADPDGHNVLAPAALRGREAQVGFNDLLDDPGGIIRRGLLVLDNGKTAAYSFPLQIALAYLKPHGIHLLPDPTNPDILRIGRTSIPPFEKNDGGYMAADAAGYQFMLDFHGARSHIPAHGFEDVLSRMSEDALRSAFSGKIVIVGTSAKSLNDSFYTPLSVVMDESDQRMAGAELHGHIVSQLLRLAAGAARPLAPVREPVELAWILAMGLLGAAIGFVSRSLVRFGLAALGAAVLIVATSYALFAHSYWLPVAVPLVACLSCLTAAAGYASQYENEQRALVMRFFAQHVSRDIADEIWRRREDFLENGRPRPTPLTATVLFTDLAGFTEISEKMQAGELFDWLNEYMQAMSEVVIEHHGVINKYIGDAIMGIFGVPFARESEAGIADDARNAVACALAMERRLKPLNRKWVSEGRKPIQMRVGIYTGPLVAGCLGGSDRLEYTVIGDTVNTASRLESAGKTIPIPQARLRGCCITIGEATRRLLDESVRVVPVGTVALKGKSEEIQAYYVEGESIGEATWSGHVEQRFRG